MQFFHDFPETKKRERRRIFYIEKKTSVRNNIIYLTEASPLPNRGFEKRFAAVANSAGYRLNGFFSEKGFT